MLDALLSNGLERSTRTAVFRCEPMSSRNPTRESESRPQQTRPIENHLDRWISNTANVRTNQEVLSIWHDGIGIERATDRCLDSKKRLRLRGNDSLRRHRDLRHHERSI